MLDSLAGVSHRHEIDSIAFDELAIRGFILVSADCHYDNSLCLQSPLHVYQGRGLRYTWSTPTSPEIQHDYLSAKLTERNLTFGVLDAEIRRWATNVIGTGATVAT